jgi:hypothetical protein
MLPITDGSSLSTGVGACLPGNAVTVTVVLPLMI